MLGVTRGVTDGGVGEVGFDEGHLVAPHIDGSSSDPSAQSATPLHRKLPLIQAP